MSAAPATEAGPRPLRGVRVPDSTRVPAGPYCTALPADLGADVLKVEPPGGDDDRHAGPFHAGRSSASFEAVRGKRGVVLDPSAAPHREIARTLAAAADGVVENVRPGVADGRGIGRETPSRANPRPVYAGLSGFGRDGPNAGRPAYDAIVRAMCGIMAHPRSAPRTPRARRPHHANP